jgi:hypothetical protein
MSFEDEWTLEDSRAASAEGWDLFATGVARPLAPCVEAAHASGHDPVELEMIDSPEPHEDAGFTDDADAWRLVWFTPSALHSKALDILRRESPGEWQRIRKWAADQAA